MNVQLYVLHFLCSHPFSFSFLDVFFSLLFFCNSNKTITLLPEITTRIFFSFFQIHLYLVPIIIPCIYEASMHNAPSAQVLSHSELLNRFFFYFNIDGCTAITDACVVCVRAQRNKNEMLHRCTNRAFKTFKYIAMVNAEVVEKQTATCTHTHLHMHCDNDTTRKKKK